MRIVSRVASALIVFSAGSAFCAQIVAPNAFSSTEAPDFQSTVVNQNPRTLQVVYAASQLGFGPGNTLLGLSFRLNGGDPTWPPTSRTWTSYDIQLSTSLNAPGSLSANFAANIGPDVVTARSGTLTFSPNSFPGGATPNSFGPEITFTTPYLYTGGSLLVTIRHTGNGVDSEFADAVTSVAGLYQDVGTGSYTATTADGTVGTATVIMRFDVNAGVPEPSAILMVLSGIGLLVTLGRRRSWRSATPD